jgi:hypothetical protein|eukprot:COSAG02_NODE_616_length_19505_cov_5.004998_16_plen_60_part_00
MLTVKLAHDQAQPTVRPVAFFDEQGYHIDLCQIIASVDQQQPQKKLAEQINFVRVATPC